MSHKMDQCQTPPYALTPLLPYIKQFSHVWEPAAGEGYLVRALETNGFTVTGTDLLTGDNFFSYSQAPDGCEVLITYPPFSVKYVWADWCYRLKLPFALLVPLEMLGSAQAQLLFRTYGVELIVYNQRVDFKMPNKGWRESSAQFPTMWLTWGLTIGSPLTFALLDKPTKKERDQWSDENS